MVEVAVLVDDDQPALGEVATLREGDLLYVDRVLHGAELLAGERVEQDDDLGVGVADARDQVGSVAHVERRERVGAHRLESRLRDDAAVVV